CALAADSSRTTHAAREAVDACRFMSALMVAAVGGQSKAELLSTVVMARTKVFGARPLVPTVAAIAEGRYRRRHRGEICSSGYVLHSLEAALWAFASTDTFRDGALLAVNLGGDSDTTGAIYGQLAGAYYGADAIPTGWREQLAQHDHIQVTADR